MASFLDWLGEQASQFLPAPPPEEEVIPPAPVQGSSELVPAGTPPPPTQQVSYPTATGSTQPGTGSQSTEYLDPTYGQEIQPSPVYSESAPAPEPLPQSPSQAVHEAEVVPEQAPAAAPVEQPVQAVEDPLAGSFAMREEAVQEINSSLPPEPVQAPVEPMPGVGGVIQRATYDPGGGDLADAAAAERAVNGPGAASGPAEMAYMEFQAKAATETEKALSPVNEAVSAAVSAVGSVLRSQVDQALPITPGSTMANPTAQMDPLGSAVGESAEQESAIIMGGGLESYLAQGISIDEATNKRRSSRYAQQQLNNQREFEVNSQIQALGLPTMTDQDQTALQIILGANYDAEKAGVDTEAFAQDAEILAAYNEQTAAGGTFRIAPFQAMIDARVAAGAITQQMADAQLGLITANALTSGKFDDFEISPAAFGQGVLDLGAKAIGVFSYPQNRQNGVMGAVIAGDLLGEEFINGRIDQEFFRSIAGLNPLAADDYSNMRAFYARDEDGNGLADMVESGELERIFNDGWMAPGSDTSFPGYKATGNVEDGGIALWERWQNELSQWDRIISTTTTDPLIAAEIAAGLASGGVGFAAQIAARRGAWGTARALRGGQYVLETAGALADPFELALHLRASPRKIRGIFHTTDQAGMDLLAGQAMASNVEIARQYEEPRFGVHGDGRTVVPPGPPLVDGPDGPPPMPDPPPIDEVITDEDLAWLNSLGDEPDLVTTPGAGEAPPPGELPDSYDLTRHGEEGWTPPDDHRRSGSGDLRDASEAPVMLDGDPSLREDGEEPDSDIVVDANAGATTVPASFSRLRSPGVTTPSSREAQPWDDYDDVSSTVQNIGDLDPNVSRAALAEVSDLGKQLAYARDMQSRYADDPVWQDRIDSIEQRIRYLRGMKSSEGSVARLAPVGSIVPVSEEHRVALIAARDANDRVGDLNEELGSLDQMTISEMTPEQKARYEIIDDEIKKAKDEAYDLSLRARRIKNASSLPEAPAGRAMPEAPPADTTTFPTAPASQAMPSPPPAQRVVAPYPHLNDSGRTLVQLLDRGTSMPAFITKSLRNIAGSNGVVVDATMTAQDVVDRLREIGSGLTPSQPIDGSTTLTPLAFNVDHGKSLGHGGTAAIRSSVEPLNLTDQEVTAPIGTGAKEIGDADVAAADRRAKNAGHVSANKLDEARSRGRSDRATEVDATAEAENPGGSDWRKALDEDPTPRREGFVTYANKDAVDVLPVRVADGVVGHRLGSTENELFVTQRVIDSDLVAEVYRVTDLSSPIARFRPSSSRIPLESIGIEDRIGNYATAVDYGKDLLFRESGGGKVGVPFQRTIHGRRYTNKQWRDVGGPGRTLAASAPRGSMDSGANYGSGWYVLDENGRAQQIFNLATPAGRSQALSFENALKSVDVARFEGDWGQAALRYLEDVGYLKKYQRATAKPSEHTTQALARFDAIMDARIDLYPDATAQWMQLEYLDIKYRPNQWFYRQTSATDAERVAFRNAHYKQMNDFANVAKERFQVIVARATARGVKFNPPTRYRSHNGDYHYQTRNDALAHFYEVMGEDFQINDGTLHLEDITEAHRDAVLIQAIGRWIAVAERFPVVKKSVTSFNLVDGFAVINGESYSVRGGSFSWESKGIYLNLSSTSGGSASGRIDDMLKPSAQFATAGTALQTIITHELAHSIDSFLGDAPFDAGSIWGMYRDARWFWKNSPSRQDIVWLSDYARTDGRETLAEIFHTGYSAYGVFKFAEYEDLSRAIDYATDLSYRESDTLTEEAYDQVGMWVQSDQFPPSEKMTQLFTASNPNQPDLMPGELKPMVTPDLVVDVDTPSTVDEVDTLIYGPQQPTLDKYLREAEEVPGIFVPIMHAPDGQMVSVGYGTPVRKSRNVAADHDLSVELQDGALVVSSTKTGARVNPARLPNGDLGYLKKAQKTHSVAVFINQPKFRQGGSLIAHNYHEQLDQMGVETIYLGAQMASQPALVAELNAMLQRMQKPARIVFGGSEPGTDSFDLLAKDAGNQKNVGTLILGKSKGKLYLSKQITVGIAGQKITDKQARKLLNTPRPELDDSAPVDVMLDWVEAQLRGYGRLQDLIYRYQDDATDLMELGALPQIDTRSWDAAMQRWASGDIDVVRELDSFDIVQDTLQMWSKNPRFANLNDPLLHEGVDSYGQSTNIQRELERWFGSGKGMPLPKIQDSTRVRLDVAGGRGSEYLGQGEYRLPSGDIAVPGDILDPKTMEPEDVWWKDGEIDDLKLAQIWSGEPLETSTRSQPGYEAIIPDVGARRSGEGEVKFGKGHKPDRPLRWKVDGEKVLIIDGDNNTLYRGPNTVNLRDPEVRFRSAAEERGFSVASPDEYFAGSSEIKAMAGGPAGPGVGNLVPVVPLPDVVGRLRVRVGQVEAYPDGTQTVLVNWVTGDEITRIEQLARDDAPAWHASSPLQGDILNAIAEASRNLLGVMDERDIAQSFWEAKRTGDAAALAATRKALASKSIHGQSLGGTRVRGGSLSTAKGRPVSQRKGRSLYRPDPSNPNRNAKLLSDITGLDADDYAPATRRGGQQVNAYDATGRRVDSLREFDPDRIHPAEAFESSLNPGEAKLREMALYDYLDRDSYISGPLEAINNGEGRILIVYQGRVVGRGVQEAGEEIGTASARLLDDHLDLLGYPEIRQSQVMRASPILESAQPYLGSRISVEESGIPDIPAYRPIQTKTRSFPKADRTGSDASLGQLIVNEFSDQVSSSALAAGDARSLAQQMRSWAHHRVSGVPTGEAGAVMQALDGLVSHSQTDRVVRLSLPQDPQVALGSIFQEGSWIVGSSQPGRAQVLIPPGLPFGRSGDLGILPRNSRLLRLSDVEGMPTYLVLDEQGLARIPSGSIPSPLDTPLALRQSSRVPVRQSLPWTRGDFSQLLPVETPYGIRYATEDGGLVGGLSDGSVLYLPPALVSADLPPPVGLGLSPGVQSVLVSSGSPPVIMAHQWPDGSVGWAAYGLDIQVFQTVVSDFSMTPSVSLDGKAHWALTGQVQGKPYRFNDNELSRNFARASFSPVPNSNPLTPPVGSRRSADDHIREIHTYLGLDNPNVLDVGDGFRMPTAMADIFMDTARHVGDRMVFNIFDNVLADQADKFKWLGRKLAETNGGVPRALDGRYNYVSTIGESTLNNDPAFNGRTHYADMIAPENGVFDARLQRWMHEEYDTPSPVDGDPDRVRRTTIGMELRNEMANLYAVKSIATRARSGATLSAAQLAWLDGVTSRFDQTMDDVAEWSQDTMATLAARKVTRNYIDYIATSRGLKLDRTMDQRVLRMVPHGLGEGGQWFQDALAEYADYMRTMTLYGNHKGLAFGMLQATGNLVTLGLVMPGAMGDYLDPTMWKANWQDQDRDMLEQIQGVDGINKIRLANGLAINNRLSVVRPERRGRGRTAGDTGDISQGGTYFERRSAIAEDRGQRKTAKAFKVVGNVLAWDKWRQFANVWDQQIRNAVWSEFFIRRQRVATFHMQAYALRIYEQRLSDLGPGAMGITPDQIVQVFENLRSRNGGFFDGRSLRSELSFVAGRDGNQATQQFALRAGEIWQSTVRGIDDLATKEVERVAFSFRPKNIDTAIGNYVFFHYWASRASYLYLGSILKHPGVFHAFINAAEGLENEADKRGWNDSAFGFLGLREAVGKGLMGTPWGFMMMMNLPYSLGPLSQAMDLTQDPDAWKRDMTEVGRFLDDWNPFMLNPVAELLLGGVGILGRDASLSSVTGTRGLESRITDIGNAAFLAPAGMAYTGGMPSDVATARVAWFVSQGIDQLTQGVPLLNLLEGMQEPDLGAGNRSEITYLMDGVLKAKYPEMDEAERNIKLAHEQLRGENSPIWREATNIWARKNLAEDAWNMVLPAQLRLNPQNKQDIQEEKARGTADVHDYFLGDLASSGGAEDLVYDMDRYIYQEGLGTPASRDLYAMNQAIYKGSLKGDQTVKIRGQEYTGAELLAMPERLRQDLADEYLDEHGGIEARRALFELNKEKLAFLESHPDTASYWPWKNSFGPDAMATIEWLKEENPGYAAYMRDVEVNFPPGHEDYVKKATDADGFAAALGIRWNSYEEQPELEGGEPVAEETLASLYQEGIDDSARFVELTDSQIKNRDDALAGADHAAAVMARMDVLDPSGYTKQLWIDKARGLRKDERIPNGIYSTLRSEFGDFFAPWAAIEYNLWKGDNPDGSVDDWSRENSWEYWSEQRDERWALREQGIDEETIEAIQATKEVAGSTTTDAGSAPSSSEWIEYPKKEWTNYSNRRSWTNYDTYERGQWAQPTDFLNLRMGPGYDHDVRRVLHGGEQLYVLGEDFMDGERWVRVRTSSGAVGYVLSRFLRKRAGRSRGRSGSSVRSGLDGLGTRIERTVKERTRR